MCRPRIVRPDLDLVGPIEVSAGPFDIIVDQPFNACGGLSGSRKLSQVEC